MVSKLREKRDPSHSCIKALLVRRYVLQSTVCKTFCFLPVQRPSLICKFTLQTHFFVSAKAALSYHTPLILSCPLNFLMFQIRCNHLHHQTWLSGQSLHHPAESDVNRAGIKYKGEGSKKQESSHDTHSHNALTKHTHRTHTLLKRCSLL